MTDAKITPTDDGPYLIEGAVSVVDADGTAYDLAEHATIFLCRCGGSRIKPFCDGTHETLHFQATERAVTARPSPARTKSPLARLGGSE